MDIEIIDCAKELSIMAHLQMVVELGKTLLHQPGDYLWRNSFLMILIPW